MGGGGCSERDAKDAGGQARRYEDSERLLPKIERDPSSQLKDDVGKFYWTLALVVFVRRFDCRTDTCQTSADSNLVCLGVSLVAAGISR